MRVEVASRSCMQHLLVNCMIAFGAAGCTPLKSFLTGKTPASQTAPASKSQQQPKPLVSNAFAYARYAALNLESHSNKELPPAEVERILLQSAENSEISPAEMVALLSLVHTPTAPETKGTSQLRFEEFQNQFNACVSKFESPAECCQALAWPAAVLPQLTSLDAERKAALKATSEAALSKSAILKGWGSFAPDTKRDAGDAALPGAPAYRLAGLKAWVGACHVVLSGAPVTLTDLLKSLDSNLSDKSRWTRVLHARSRAKRGPRRIFTRADGQMSLAETLASDCTVKETEVVRRRRDGTLDYWVYDAQGNLTPVSHFPTPNNNQGFVTVEKLSPDSCMGCHYNFETRHFDQLMVSADALGLPQTIDLPLVCLQPGETLAKDN